jgi:hypothetical protein
MPGAAFGQLDQHKQDPNHDRFLQTLDPMHLISFCAS